MNRIALLSVAVIAITAFAVPTDAQEFHRIHHPFSAPIYHTSPFSPHANRTALRHARGMSWHYDYAHPTTGVPIAFVVPPTAHMHTHWSWGVSQTETTPIYHQFRRNYDGSSEIVEGTTLTQLTPPPTTNAQPGGHYQLVSYAIPGSPTRVASYIWVNNRVQDPLVVDPRMQDSVNSLFGQYDADDSNSLDADEWRRANRSEPFSDIDGNNNQSITPSEFSQWMLRRSGTSGGASSGGSGGSVASTPVSALQQFSGPRYRTAPRAPSSTKQLGVYPVRGPY